VAVVLVTGGTGRLGTHLVPILRGRGHDVRVLSRRAGAGTHVGDLTSGEGLAEAAAGAELVLHAASDERRLGRPDLEQTRRVVAAAGAARHLLYVSIVGIDAIPLAYYKHKLACEVAAAEVAQRAAELLDGEPLARAPDFGGPEVLTVRAIVDTWRTHRGRPRRIVRVRVPGRIARAFREGRNTCPDHAEGRQRWREFVASG
jgi:uncharacterized protein YbjT (DUF2867 family)